MTHADRDRVDRIVDQWRRERPDLDQSCMEVTGRLARAAALAQRDIERVLCEHGLEPGWFDVLASLRRAGAPYELNPRQLIDATMLSSGGMTKRLDRLEQAGLVQRRPDPKDRRGTRVQLTKGGREVVDAAVERHTANLDRLLEHLNKREQQQLADLLRKWLHGLEAMV